MNVNSSRDIDIDDITEVQMYCSGTLYSPRVSSIFTQCEIKLYKKYILVIFIMPLIINRNKQVSNIWFQRQKLIFIKAFNNEDFLAKTRSQIKLGKRKT